MKKCLSLIILLFLLTSCFSSKEDIVEDKINNEVDIEQDNTEAIENNTSSWKTDIEEEGEQIIYDILEEIEKEFDNAIKDVE